MDVRVDEITGVRFVRELHPFSSYTGPELLAVQFLGQSRDIVLYCYMHELYDGQRPEKLAAWRALRERYGNRDESRSIRAPCWVSLGVNESEDRNELGGRREGYTAEGCTASTARG